MHVEEKAASLAAFVDSLQERGQYTFSRDEALSALGSTPIALKRAAERLKAKRRLATPRRGFYTIVPLEYRQSGSPPAASFIDQLMQFHGTPYYVGLCRRRRSTGRRIRDHRSSRYSPVNNCGLSSSDAIGFVSS